MLNGIFGGNFAMGGGLVKFFSIFPVVIKIKQHYILDLHAS
jgi:hypothetical protein